MCVFGRIFFCDVRNPKFSEILESCKKFHGKNPDLVDSGFVKTCDELVKGLQVRWPLNQLRQIQLPQNQLPQPKPIASKAV